VIRVDSRMFLVNSTFQRISSSLPLSN
jgi:hypothetical protein